MSRIVFCLKFKEKKIGLKYLPFYGILGKYIYYNISKKAWDLWLKQQTILINEKSLILSKNKDREFIFYNMKKFLFE